MMIMFLLVSELDCINHSVCSRAPSNVASLEKKRFQDWLQSQHVHVLMSFVLNRSLLSQSIFIQTVRAAGLEVVFLDT